MRAEKQSGVWATRGNSSRYQSFGVNQLGLLGSRTYEMTPVCFYILFFVFDVSESFVFRKTYFVIVPDTLFVGVFLPLFGVAMGSPATFYFRPVLASPPAKSTATYVPSSIFPLRCSKRVSESRFPVLQSGTACAGHKQISTRFTPPVVPGRLSGAPRVATSPRFDTNPYHTMIHLHVLPGSEHDW